MKHVSIYYHSLLISVQSIGQSNLVPLGKKLLELNEYHSPQISTICLRLNLFCSVILQQAKKRNQLPRKWKQFRFYACSSAFSITHGKERFSFLVKTSCILLSILETNSFLCATSFFLDEDLFRACFIFLTSITTNFFLQELFLHFLWTILSTPLMLFLFSIITPDGDCNFKSLRAIFLRSKFRAEQALRIPTVHVGHLDHHLFMQA